MRNIVKNLVAATAACAALAFAPPASAQSASPFFEFAEADAAGVSVSLTVLGQTTTLGSVVVDQSFVVAPGEDDEPLAGYSVGLPGLPVLTLSGVDDLSEASASDTSAYAEGFSSTGTVNMLGGLVVIDGLVTDATCDVTAGVAACAGSTMISQLRVAGHVIPTGSIAPNTTIPVVGTVGIHVLGMSLPLPVNLTLTLNEQYSGGDGLTYAFTVVNGAHLTGSAQLPGLASLNVDIVVSGPEGLVSNDAGAFSRLVTVSNNDVCVAVLGAALCDNIIQANVLSNNNQNVATTGKGNATLK